MGSFINNGTIEGGFTGVRFDQTAITTIVNNGTIIGSIKGGNADRTWRSAGMEIMAQNIGSLENPENRGIYTQSDSSKKSSRNIWSLAVVSVDQRY